MIDNEKVKKAITNWAKSPIYSKTETDFFDQCGYIGNLGRAETITFYAGYSARDKDAEEEKRELIEALINLYPSTIYRNYEGGLSYDKELKALIEKHTGKPIDEVLS